MWKEGEMLSWLRLDEKIKKVVGKLLFELN